MRPLFLAGAPLLLAALACSGAANGGGSVDIAELEATLLATGSHAPEVTLTGMDDQDFALSSLRGRTLLINFWFFH
jgi:cytochrome oxidase Cu insertion factor (SCO1/SenC/PrrC family)